MGAGVTEEPSDEAYGRVTNPERFRALHRATHEQIDRLVTGYEVERVDGIDLDPTSARVWPGSPATTLIPATGATLTFTLTPFPGVMLRFGYGGHEGFPRCGCDACDEDPADEQRRIAEIVSGVVAGGFAETRRRRLLRSDTYESWMTHGDAHVLTHAGPSPIDPDVADQMPRGTTEWRPWSPVP